jgi:7-carboxy-7-deazaguanine synthase
MLYVNEIFHSIQGESSYSGLSCVFIRLTGCNLRCIYCDTKYAYKKGQALTVDNIIDQIKHYECQLVEITGGEPLLQKETPILVQKLRNLDYQILVETNGTQNIDQLGGDIVRILDIKCPGSGESDKTDWKNIDRLMPNDEVKFVLSSQSDYNWAKKIVQKYKLDKKVTILFSPVYGILAPEDLAAWILETKLKIRFQIQLHKIFWPKNEKR